MNTTNIAASEEPDASAGATPAKTVLIVEPMPDRQWKLARIFTVSGYRVIGASVVGAARALLQTCPVDLILLSSDARAENPGAADELTALAPEARVLTMQPDAQPDARNDRPVESPILKYVARPERMSDVAALAYG